MPNTSNHDHVQSLRSVCLAALEAFVNQANATVEMFSEIQETPVSLPYRSSILNQRREENDAYERYHIARLALFKMAAEGKLIYSAP